MPCKALTADWLHGCCRFYCEEALSVSNYSLSPLPSYYIPDSASLQSYKVGPTAMAAAVS